MNLTKNDMKKLIEAYMVLNKINNTWDNIPNSDVMLVKGRFILKPELNNTMSLFKKICLPYVELKNG